MSEHMWSKVLTLTLAAMLGGCAGAQDRAPATAAAEELPFPTTPGQARAELASLEQQIQRGRQGLGLPGRPESAVAMEGVDQGAGAVTEAEADQAPAAEPAEVPRAVQSSRWEGWSHKDKRRCSDPCRLAQAICRAARRICTLADYLRDDDARGKCSRAKDDCNEARDKAGSCKDCL